MKLDQIGKKLDDKCGGKLCDVQIGSKSPLSRFYFRNIMLINSKSANNLQYLYAFAVISLSGQTLDFKCIPVRK